ncbi:helix-turn-helix transcriptional regulator [Natronoglycomyces albus]|uniref:AAA family ATPase n=1 Tax=Natronoglycomyces albus TaxID=2811108 RepID=A0A895XFQ2_9ACTN|nr:LuxR family transcriptional regulator [Natronoglycomyces albus]QSB04681.1 AAA family ATPase [Natronoglycomyces albus]
MSVPITFCPPIERLGVLSHVRKSLAVNYRAILCGLPGVGKSVLIDQFLSDVDDALIMRAHPTDRCAPYATLAELLCEVDESLIDDLTPPRRDAVSTLLRRNASPMEQVDTVAVHLGVRDLFRVLTGERPMWLVIDPADHIDASSLKLLSQLWKHVSPVRLRLLLAARQPGLYRKLGATAQHEIGIPPWDLAEIVEVLAPLQLPNRHVAGIHRASGGRVDLALRIGGTMRASGSDGIAPSFGPAVETIAHEQLAALSPRAQHTLLVAAMALHPTEAMLRRAGCSKVHEDLVEATREGLTAVDATGLVTFHAESTSEALLAAASSVTVKRVHRRLAEVVADSVASVRHRAMATDGPDAELAAELDRGCAVAKGRGDLVLASELSLLAADHTPAQDDTEATRRLVAATELAAAAGRITLVERAARAVFERGGDPSDRLRAQLAVINAAGQDFEQVREIFSAAAANAKTDPALQAELALWRAWRTHIIDGDLCEVLEQARRAEQLAESSGNAWIHMQTMTMVGRVQRMLGDPAAETTIARAYAIHPDPATDIPGSARFVWARHALFDDRLDDARSEFGALLELAKQQGDLKALTEVLRSLAEIELRSGNCVEARELIDRALAHLAHSDLSLSPLWYVSALIETAAGDHRRATTLAGQGLAAAREDHDVVFTIRNLFVLGQLDLHASRSAAAVEKLREVQSLEDRCNVGDPSVLHWRGELAEALVQTGEVEAAWSLISHTRDRAAELGRENVQLRMDVAEASCRVAAGEHAKAAELLERARSGFARMGLRIEQGRAILAMGVLERRRRRRGHARQLLGQASELFAECGAGPWIEQVDAEQRLLEDAPTTETSGYGPLTTGEARIAKLVIGGASNRQTATALNVSVKTIESRLSRIYRKLGIQSRTQLANYQWERSEQIES